MYMAHKREYIASWITKFMNIMHDFENWLFSVNDFFSLTFMWSVFDYESIGLHEDASRRITLV